MGLKSSKKRTETNVPMEGLGKNGGNAATLQELKPVMEADCPTQQVHEDIRSMEEGIAKEKEVFNDLAAKGRLNKEEKSLMKECRVNVHEFQHLSMKARKHYK